MYYVVSDKLTAEEIAGGSILLIALIVGFVFSILWNKGMLPRTRYTVKALGQENWLNRFLNRFLRETRLILTRMCLHCLSLTALLTTCYKVVELNRLVTSCSNNLLSSCNSTSCQQVVSDNFVAT
jgi:hypothetical protein